MTLPTPNTFQGSVLKLGGTAVEDGIVEMTISLSRETSQLDTWGGSISGVGSLKGEGTINTVYEETAGRGYTIAQSEFLTPTAGGIACVFQPLGACSGTYKEWTFNIVIGQDEEGGPATDIAQGNFSFTTTGAIVYTTQS
jgi:hypothetical protein